MLGWRKEILCAPTSSGMSIRGWSTLTHPLSGTSTPDSRSLKPLTSTSSPIRTWIIPPVHEEGVNNGSYVCTRRKNIFLRLIEFQFATTYHLSLVHHLILIQ
eukprot:213078_1